MQYRLMSDSWNTTVSNWYNDYVSITPNIEKGGNDISLGDTLKISGIFSDYMQYLDLLGKSIKPTSEWQNGFFNSAGVLNTSATWGHYNIMDVTELQRKDIIISICCWGQGWCCFKNSNNVIIGNAFHYSDSQTFNRSDCFLFVRVPETATQLCLTNIPKTGFGKIYDSEVFIIEKDITINENLNLKDITLKTNNDNYVIPTEENLVARMKSLYLTKTENALIDYTKIVFGKYLTANGSESDHPSLCYYSDYIEIPDYCTSITLFRALTISLFFYDSNKNRLNNGQFGEGFNKTINVIANAKYIRFNLDSSYVPTYPTFTKNAFYVYFNIVEEDILSVDNTTEMGNVVQYPTSQAISISNIDQNKNTVKISGSVSENKIAIVIPQSFAPSNYIRRIYDRCVFAFHSSDGGKAWYIYLGSDTTKTGKIYKVIANGTETEVDSNTITLDEDYKYLRIRKSIKNNIIEFCGLTEISAVPKKLKEFQFNENYYPSSGFALSEGLYNDTYQLFDSLLKPSIRIKQNSIIEYGDADYLVGYNEAKGGFVKMSYPPEEIADAKTHGNCLNKPFILNGKKFTFFGDSITSGVSSAPVWGTITNCYAKLLTDHYSGTLNNRAVSGAKICDLDNPSNSILNRIINFTGSTDIIIIAGGINDYGAQSPIGTTSDTTYATFYGSLYLICEYLKDNYSDKTIIFLTPINRSISSYVAPISLNTYRNAIFYMAVKYGFNVIDGSTLGFPDYNEADLKNLLIYDGLHPTDIGHSFMAKCLAGILS